ncbi:M15 family metallopeptidase [Anaeromicropila herbilytica]|uniref:Peptidase M15C domain-containing protein n=1 Tax=Anaeromicropila herbilytica TaxID=2785025 RepID=A0A7R7IFB3_9FIRM|nr:M15 family metallopeptidase [Anaeromicropila herbilytica]BCN32916.1 hypothetical protein bsdtb5_42110 [Anaeromicropila herbilytica]
MKNKTLSFLFLCVVLLFIVSYGMNWITIKYNSNKNSIKKNESKVAMNIKDDKKDRNLISASISPTEEDVTDKEALSIASIARLDVNTIINTKNISDAELESYFYAEEVPDDVFERMYCLSYKKNCTVPLSDLNYVRVLYYGFDDKTHIGELVVNRQIADDTINIMRELYHAKYPIERMQLIDDYSADDEKSMTANNTSCFNYRSIAGSKKLSKHSEGLAIDINPFYNPYVKTVDGKEIISPLQGVTYADRSLKLPYLIKENDVCYQTFHKYGFTWGGSWHSLKDYQHFEKDLSSN